MSYKTSNGDEILLVDDNSDIITMFRFALQRAGYHVRTAMSGREAVQSVERFGLPSLALVDINMADMNGFEFARYLRQKSRAPIIMITAQPELSFKVDALSEFADDYLVKPFSTEELLARVERVLRRTRAQKPTDDWIIVDARLRFNAARQQAELEGVMIELTPLETQTLQLLAAQPGQVVFGDHMLASLWPAESPTRDQLRVLISRLRKKLQRPSDSHDYIVTERGVGYRLEADNGA
jgi:DNA-binding response OmpR family regulator